MIKNQPFKAVSLGSFSEDFFADNYPKATIGERRRKKFKSKIRRTNYLLRSDANETLDGEFVFF